MGTIAANLQGVKSRIRRACEGAGRDPREIVLVAVSKTFPAGDIGAAHEAGQRCFGESYVQEAVGKIEALAALGLEWHFIGPIQSNKTREIATHFDWVHSVDRLRIAERLSAQRPPERGPLDVLLQVNISGEATKSGVSPAELDSLAKAVARLPSLRLRGLMAIPEPTEDMALARGHFEAVRALKDALCAEGLALDTLSMGMTDDLEPAIAAGATMVRVGTAIFGERTAK
jgi:pyridoxal phosphate enzyme (YggS family)